MSKKPDRISSADRDQDARSVFDFLYHDARRVGSFLAQLDPNGHLQSLKRTTQAASGNVDKVVTQAGIGFPTVGNIGRTADHQITEQELSGADRTYDPLWTNAISLLNLLNDRGLIERDMHKAPVGQIVLVTGALKFLNLRLVEKLLSSDAVSNLVEFNSSNLDMQNGLNQRLALETLKSFPHSLQAHLSGFGEPGSLSWMSLDDESMVVSPSDLSIKYGVWVPGGWTVLGIKDARADEASPPEESIVNGMSSDWDATAQAHHTTPMALLAEIFAPMARMVMGRPSHYYGITPIMIFRELGKAEQEIVSSI